MHLLLVALILTSLLPRPTVFAAETSPTDSLDVARNLSSTERYREAEQLSQRLLERLEATQSPDSSRWADVAEILVDARQKQHRAGGDVLAMAARCAAIRERAFGPESPAISKSLRLLGIALGGVANYDSAEVVLKRAVRIAESHSGPESREVAQILDELAGMLSDGGNYAGAVEIYRRTLRLWEHIKGPDDFDVSVTARNLGIALQELGNFSAADSFYQRALSIREKRRGPDDPSVAMALLSIGLLRADTGDLAGSLPFYERALSIWERTEGPEGPSLLYGLNNLASALRRLGEFNAAQAHLERALSIAEKAFGAENAYTAGVLFNLGDVHLERGDVDGARPLYERCLEVARKTLGPEHPRMVLPLWRLSRLATERGDHREAVRLGEQALQIATKAFGSDNVKVADALMHLGIAQLNAGELAGARRNLARAIQTFEKSLGPSHPQTAAAVASLADVDRLAGNHAAAIRGFRRAVEDFARNEEPGGPSGSHASLGLARALHAAGQDTAAFSAALGAESGSREHLSVTMRVLSEREALAYESYRASGLDVALGIASAAGARDPLLEARALDAVIRSRAVVLDELAQRHRSGWGRGDSAVARLAGEFAAAQTSLSRALVQGPSGIGPGQHRVMLERLRRASETAEAALAARSGRFRAKNRRDHAGLSEIAAALPEHSALLSYVEYTRERRGSKSAPAGARSRREFLAFVLRDGAMHPSVIPLGAVARVEALVQGWQAAVSHSATKGRTSTGRDAYSPAGVALRRAVWDPVAPHLTGAKRVFIVPDGVLNLVSFYTLPARTGRFLAEDGPLIHYLSSERDLLFDETPVPGGGGLLALGGPDFDALPEEPALAGAPAGGPGTAAAGGTGAAAAAGSGATSAPYRGHEPACEDFRSVRFLPLPGSLREVEGLDSLWTAAGAGQAMVRTGSGATETVIKTRASGSAVVHLATHAFFLGRGCADLIASTRGIGGTGAPGPIPDEAPYLKGENPLLLSGLALAGSNNRDRSGPDRDDGILTAEEIAALDLSRTSWVVLSACETGVGEVRAGEGVFGLRRAFQIAGAHTLIMSLWDVDDESAEAWMRSLYEPRFARGLDTAAAVREATLALLHERRAKGRSTSPFYWGAFVAAGDWR